LIIDLLDRRRQIFVLLRHSHRVFVVCCCCHHPPLLGALLPSSSFFAANDTSATAVKMKPLEDVAINDNNNTGKKPKRRKLLPWRGKKRLKKEPLDLPPRNTSRARMRPQMSHEPQTRMTLPRILPHLKWIRTSPRQGPLPITTSLARLPQQTS
jgi:hypothetical protein